VRDQPVRRSQRASAAHEESAKEEEGQRVDVLPPSATASSNW